VTGGAILLIGLLLVLAGLAAARIPGGARIARPGIVRFILAPIDPQTWYANASIFLGLFTGILAGGMVLAVGSTGLTTLVGGIGFVFMAMTLEASRLVARVERWRASLGQLPRPPAHPYRPLRGSIGDVLRAEFLDESRWRDVLYVAVNVPLAVLEFAVAFAVWGAAFALITAPAWYDAIAGLRLPGTPLTMPGLGGTALAIAVVAGVVLLAVAASLSQLIATLHRGVVTALLCTSESRVLRRQVEELRQSRSAVLDVEANELHRIERDLHDGAQQRLVALTIDLGLAAERVDADPAAAKALILDGQTQARDALAEIRDLVRGIAPPILVDRGLVAAIESIVGRGPVATTLASDLTPRERLPAVIERTAYFVVSEALANVVKHSGATRCEVRCRREAGGLVVEVWDDGTGGARLEPDGGLAGLEGRVAGVDGRLVVSSPPGGPTLVRAELPLPEVGQHRQDPPMVVG
jgi:signal transduction histidine kinase